MSRPRFMRWFASSRPSDSRPANQPSVRSSLSCFEPLEDRSTPAVIVPVAHSGTNYSQSAPAITNASAGVPNPTSYQTNPAYGSNGTINIGTSVGTGPYGLSPSSSTSVSVGSSVASTAADQAFLSLAAQNEMLSFILSSGAAQQGATAAVRQAAQVSAAQDVQLLGAMVSLMDPSTASGLTSTFLQAFQAYGATGARGAAATQQYLALNGQLQTMNLLLFQSEATSNSGSAVQAFAQSALPQVQFQFQSAIQAENRGLSTAASSLGSALSSQLSPLNALFGSVGSTGTVGTVNLPTSSGTTTTSNVKGTPTHTPAYPNSGTTTTGTTNASTGTAAGNSTNTATGTSSSVAGGSGTSTGTGTQSASGTGTSSATGTGTGTATNSGSTGTGTTGTGTTGTGTTGSNTTTGSTTTSGSKTDPTHTPA